MNSKLQPGAFDPALPEPSIRYDFETVHSAVLETERGRWFLGEFSRRQRAIETSEILFALERLAMRVMTYEAFLGQASNAHDTTLDIALAASALRLSAIDTTKPHADLGERLTALSEIDALDVEAKIKLFA